MKKNLAYGSWSSPISAAMVAGKSPKLSDAQIHGKRIFWSESIAEEKSRNAIMMHDGERLQCLLPTPLSAKSKVHEYGGAAYTVSEHELYFVLADDQAIYRGDFSREHFVPQRMTPADSRRYADLTVDAERQRIIAVCEEHHGPQHSDVDNYLVGIDMSGDEMPIVLAKGYDFYSNPRVSPDGRMLAWLCWNHPDMPWDNTELWLADIDDTGLKNPRKIAGVGNESIFQPEWSPDGELFFVSDRSNWWNIYRIAIAQMNKAQPESAPVLKLDAEFATPQWVFGMATYGFLDANTLFASYTKNGVWEAGLIKLRPGDIGTLTPLANDCSVIASVRANNGRACFIGASPYSQSAVYLYEKDQLHSLSLKQELASPQEFSKAQPVTFATSENDQARALFYPPNNSKFHCDTELPPLIVLCHGGPTGACDGSLNLKIQYWTSRGFAVADVNYRGSTGYGREFRQRLRGKWGIYDVDDVCAVVEHLASNNMIDKDRCVIKGGSAGGYTVLAALAFRDVFGAGVSLYGIGDLEMLAHDTHKFEARYMDRLVGIYPEESPIYRERSPIHFIDNIDCPLLIFQGEQDKVVPPNQARSMFNAVKTKGIPVACVIYPEEGHGFHNSTNIQHMLESEQQFYATLFGFALAEKPATTLNIENLETQPGKPTRTL